MAGSGAKDWILPDNDLASVFKKVKTVVEEKHPTVFFDWSRPVLSEITPNVERSLKGKFQGCDEGYAAAKIAALYTFWIAKLKPAFSIMSTHFGLNEWIALCVGFAIVRERLGVSIRLSQAELLDICDTLRYHTSSPHTMLHIFIGWIEREKLRNHS